MFIIDFKLPEMLHFLANLFVILYHTTPLEAQGSSSVETYGVFESCSARMEEAAHANLELWGLRELSNNATAKK